MAFTRIQVSRLWCVCVCMCVCVCGGGGGGGGTCVGVCARVCGCVGVVCGCDTPPDSTSRDCLRWMIYQRQSKTTPTSCLTLRTPAVSVMT